MVAVAQGQSLGPALPTLQALIIVEGVLQDPYSLSFKVSERVTDRAVPTQVFPVSGVQTVNLGTNKLAVGQYAATWAVPADADIGDWEITWQFQLESGGDTYTYTAPFEVIASYRMNGPLYASVQSMRDEGFLVASISDMELHRKLVLASKLVEVYTGRSFQPVRKTVTLDGKGAQNLLLQEPIIAIEAVSYPTDRILWTTAETVDLNDLRVYNRHLTQGLTDPDDRESPRIGFGDWYMPYGSEMRPLDQRRFPVGNQNVRVTGVFGYTDPDGTPTGGVPDQIAYVTRLLAVRDLPALSNQDARDDAQLRWKLTSERTRDQSYSMLSGVDAAARATVVGSITGDPRIDQILIMYRRGPYLGAA